MNEQLTAFDVYILTLLGIGACCILIGLITGYMIGSNRGYETGFDAGFDEAIDEFITVGDNDEDDTILDAKEVA